MNAPARLDLPRRLAARADDPGTDPVVLRATLDASLEALDLEAHRIGLHHPRALQMLAVRDEIAGCLQAADDASLAGVRPETVTRLLRRGLDALLTAPD